MHPNYLKNYSKLTVQKRKIGTSTYPSSSKQLKVDSIFPVKHVSPVTVNTAILRYFIQGLHPFSTVDLSSFKELSSTLQPGSSVITRPTLRSKIAEAALIMKQKVTAAMREVEWIATTVDCWTAHRKSFIGITAYWINPESLERYSAALACKRLNGSHTFEVLASAINDIHSEYEIRDMVVCTTTDSGSNFLKAQEFLEQKTMISRLKQVWKWWQHWFWRLWWGKWWCGIPRCFSTPGPRWWLWIPATKTSKVCLPHT